MKIFRKKKLVGVLDDGPATIQTTDPTLQALYDKCKNGMFEFIPSRGSADSGRRVVLSNSTIGLFRRELERAGFTPE